MALPKFSLSNFFYYFSTILLIIVSLLLLLIVGIILSPFWFVYSIIRDIWVHRYLKKNHYNACFFPTQVAEIDLEILNTLKSCHYLKTYEVSLEKTRINQWLRGMYYPNERALLIVFEGDSRHEFKIHKVVKKFKGGNRIRLDNMLIKIKEYDQKLFNK